MKEVTLKRETEAWRGKPTTTQPWPELVRYWEHFAKDMPNLEPLHHVIAALASSSPVASSLFGRITWHGIALSDTPNFRSTDNTLEIGFFPGSRHFEFRHRTFAGHADRKLVTESEALETLRLFLKYKYAVLFEIPAANAWAAANGTARPSS